MMYLDATDTRLVAKKAALGTFDENNIEKTIFNNQIKSQKRYVLSIYLRIYKIVISVQL